MIFSIIALCLGIGFLLLMRIHEEKKNFLVPLFSFVPQQTQLFIYVKELKAIDKSVHFPSDFQHLFQYIKKNSAEPCLIWSKDNDFVLCQKITFAQEQQLRDETLPSIFPAFPPKIISEDSTRYYCFINEDDSFFIATFIDGTFLGSYNFNLLKLSVENHFNKKNLQFENKIQKFIDKQFELGQTVFFTQNGNLKSVFIQEKDRDTTRLFGIQIGEKILKSDNVPDIHYDLLPDSLTYFRFEKEVSYPLLATLFSTTVGNEYQFTYASTFGKADIRLIPLKFGVKLIDSLQQYSTSKKQIKGYPFLSFFGQYSLYHIPISEDQSDSIQIFWTQWKDNLIISADAKDIVRYVRYQEKRQDSTQFSQFPPEKNNQLVAQFYFSNLTSAERFDFFSPQLQNILNISNKKILFNCFLNKQQQNFQAIFFQ